MRTNQPFRHCAALVAGLLLALQACGGDDGGGAEGTYVHPEEGTITLESGGDGSLTQETGESPFEWELDDETVSLTIDGEVVAEATLDGDRLTFRPGDFSGDEPAVFVRD